MKISELNKLHRSHVDTLSESPLVGALTLETDTGPILLAINAPAAEILVDALMDFLGYEDEEEDDEDEGVAN